MSVVNDKKIKGARNIRELVAVKIDPDIELKIDPLTYF